MQRKFKMTEKNILHIIENNKPVDIEILEYFTLESNNLDYIIYKYVNKNDNLVYASQIIEDNDKVTLNPIKNKKIITELQQVVKELAND